MMLFRLNWGVTVSISITGHAMFLSPRLLAPLLACICLASSFAPSLAQAQDAPQPAPVPFMADLSDLPRDLAAMKEAKIPMLLFVHASYCTYCHVVDSNFIQPLVNDPAYQGKLIVRRIEIDAPLAILDRHGNKESNMDFARRLGVQLVPVVAFFGPDGQAIGAPIMGVTVPDFYPYYLQQGIDLAERCAKTPDLKACIPPQKADRRTL